MNRLIYRLMYRFTKPGWDTGITPPEVVEAFQNGSLPEGPVLDLGCGTGTNAIYMARQGRQAFGLDYVPRAIETARRAAANAAVTERAQFFVADVTRLDTLKLPPCAFALDMGCFHDLSAEQQQRYAALLAAQLVPGGRYLLFTLKPRQEAGYRFGVSREQVEAVFSPGFEITRREDGMGGGATWFWMTKRHGDEPRA
jgi:cyclopropane fatty-acyl-phospholipid synthase-like methyltransferase